MCNASISESVGHEVPHAGRRLREATDGFKTFLNIDTCHVCVMLFVCQRRGNIQA